MANRTVKDAHSIHGTNPQYLIEKIIRTRIYESKYWKEECFGLTAELVVDKAMELRFIGGVYGGNIKPSPFLCLTLKMLQIQPEKDIIVEFIKNEDFKYVRLLGALYMRLTGSATDCYKYLEPLYNDYRKVKRQSRDGEFELIHVDEFMDELLHEERVCDIILPRLQKRYVLEEAELLDTRVSALEEDMDDVDTSEDEDEDDNDKNDRAPTPEPPRRGYRDLDRPRRSPSPRYRRSRSKTPRRRSRSPKRRRERHRSKSPRRHRSRSRDRRHRSRSKSPGHHRSHRHRSHSKSPDRPKKSHKKSRRGNE
ncbi:pre-mRNA-splicing factor 38A isoform X2 [Callorhinchus milii]|uniref:pre-mRNA-splicing factor 38A isoform X2 n=1 Tax=Callorhinchus milii TaxID=7868 RepID=UPI0004575255|nr:pre-mRNA-splicing factor 38A isoform X2 [Callorhinchus milii]|eukprot:gi/632963905/ref/XP_007898139.1/ PREDICTED: pre-mRNA-splicing factor 38A isoform X2 [Callorhinchus milii]